MSDWVLRDEILVATHRWPIILVFILAGSLLGWAGAMIWPAPYQASSDLSVGLDPYRATDDSYVPVFANTEFRNPDDYKHWQMSQLSVLSFSDEYLEETLNRLRAKDAAWENADVPQVRNMVSVYWRNAGRWRLAAQAENPGLASQLVETWREVILEKSNQAISHSKQVYLLDLELQAIEAEQLETSLQAEELLEIEGVLSDWREELAGKGGGDALLPEDYARLQELGARLVALDHSWQVLVEAIPVQGSAISEYLTWIDGITGMVEQKEELLQARLESLQEKQSRVNEEWQASLQEGRGLSATLTVQNTQEAAPDVSHPRPVGEAALVGAILGFLAWAFYQFARISRAKAA